MAFHAAALTALVGWQGAGSDDPLLKSRYGQTSLMVSPADPNPGTIEDNDSLAEPSLVLGEPIAMSPPQPVPAADAEPEVDGAAVAPKMSSADIETENELSLLPPQAALEPIDDPSQAESEETPTDPAAKTATESPPGDDTPTSSPPSPGLMGNDQPTDPGFENNPPILYPPEAIGEGVEGTVLLRIRIAVDGRVVAVDVVTSSGSSVLDRAAIKGVSTWRGRPARIAGHAIEAAALLPVVFRLH